MSCFHLYVTVIDNIGASSFWSKVFFYCLLGKCSPTSNLVVNSFSNKGSVTTLTASSAVANLSTQLQAMLVGSAGESN